MVSKPEKPEKPKLNLFAPWKEQSLEGKIEILKAFMWPFFLVLVVAAIFLNMHGEPELYLMILLYWLGKLGMFVKGIF